MSDNSTNWFGKLFKRGSQLEQRQDPVVAPQPTPEEVLQPGVPYRKGDFIGQRYEVQGILGGGGFGVVYLVYLQGTDEVYALKTFLDEFVADQEVKKRFYKEASVWVAMGRYPYLVRAHFVDEISGRLYIAMEYIAPNDEGLNTLDGYLERRPPDLAQSLRWSIQICHGMEYAYSKGVRAHRDLKPTNIMITQDKTAKITDFGLAGVLTESPVMGATGLSPQPGGFGLAGQTMLGTGFGTPTHMAPEQFDNAAGCDERSDIYSFGIVLYQMVAGGQVPFPLSNAENLWQGMRQFHRESPVPYVVSPLWPVIQHCLEKSPERRYQTFESVRNDLEPLLLHQTGEVVIPPQLTELEVGEWANKGGSLANLGRYQEAIRCLDKALELDPHRVAAWCNKGTSLARLGRNEEALLCLDEALALEPRVAASWNSKGNILDSMGRHEDAIHCYDNAVELDPRNVQAWYDRGISLDSMGRHEDAIHCYDNAVALDPRYVQAWYNRGISLDSMGRYEDAIHCYDKAVELDPSALFAWNNKGASLSSLDRYDEAIRCYEKALELDPRHVRAWLGKASAEDSLGQWKEAAASYKQSLALASAQDVGVVAYARKRLQAVDGHISKKVSEQIPEAAQQPAPLPELGSVGNWNNEAASLASRGRYEEALLCLDKALAFDPRVAGVWNNKGKILDWMGRYADAIHCYDKALELDPVDPEMWHDKGASLDSTGRYEEAIDSYDKVLELDPRHVRARFGKAFAEDSLGKWQEAATSYEQFLGLATGQQDALLVAYARKRLQEVAGKMPKMDSEQNPGVVPEPIPEPDPVGAATWYAKGNALLNSGRFEDAIHCYDKALELDPHYGNAWYNKGASLDSLGRYEDAVLCYDKALELDPRSAIVWTDKGNTLNGLGRYEDAVLCYDKALELDPRSAIVWTNKGNTLNGLGRYEDAVLCYDKALELDPRDAASWRNRGTTLCSLRRYEDAIRCYDKALELDPRNSDAWINRALAEDVLGGWREAVRSYQQFLALNPTHQHARQIEHAHKRLQELGSR